MRKLAAITVLIALAASAAPFVINTSMTLNDPNEYYAYTAYLSGVATTLALIWIIINAVLQSQQLAFQQEEIKLQRKALSTTAAATFSQFYIMYFDEFELALDRIANRAMELLSLDTKIANERRRTGERDSHIRTLAKTDNLLPLIKTKLSSDTGDILRETIDEYLRIYNQLSDIANNSSDVSEGKNILKIFEVSNPAVQLRRTFESATQYVAIEEEVYD